MSLGGTSICIYNGYFLQCRSNKLKVVLPSQKKKTSEREEGTEREGSRKGLMHTITNDVNVSKDRNVKSSSTDTQADSLNVREMLGTLPHR